MPTLRYTLSCAAIAFVLAVPARAAEEARVTLLHTTDLHGALTPWDYARDRSANRGLTRLATLIRAARAEGIPTLLVDAGDAIEGGIESAYRMGPQRRPDPMIAAMNALGYDAMTVGNHEFDDGWSALGAARQAAKFPWLGANVVKSRGGRPLFVPSVVRQAGPIRIGVIGVCTPAVPMFVDASRVQGVRFDDPVAAARREVQRLRTTERCDAVVLVAHTGLERDPVTGEERRGDTPDENWGYRLATQVSGIDALVLGHTHVVVAAAQVQGVLVTQAGKWGENLGRIDLVFSRENDQSPWRVAERRARVIAVTDSVAEDSALAASARPWHDEARSVLAQPVGTTIRDIASPQGRLANGAAWELIHRAQIDATGADVSLAALADPSAEIARGTITRRDLLRLYPYGNTLGVVEMTGAELRATLEQSARYFADYHFAGGAALTDPGMPGYNDDTAYGVDYAIDLTRPAGDRITRLTFRGAPVAAGQRLTVAVNSYRMNGGGGFEAVRNARRIRTLPILVRDAIAKYLEKSGPFDGIARPNWTLLPRYAATQERDLIDGLVRRGALPESEAIELDATAPARGRDIEHWLAHAYAWPAAETSGADDAAGRAAAARSAGIAVPAAVTRTAIEDACASAARRAKYAGFQRADGAEVAASFRRSLTTGTSLAASPGDSVTCAQALGMIANARYPTIRVLETTDFHGAILPGQRRSNRPVGSSPALSAWIRRLRAENPEGTVLIDGGDLFQGTMISNLQFGRPVVEQMNMLGYAAAAIGNHEFDWTADTLERRVREMRFAALGANLRVRKTGAMPDWVRSDTSFVRRGVGVSVIGLCYRFTPTVTLKKNVAALEFLDDSTTAASMVPRLRSASDVVIGVGHIPAESDSSRRLKGGDLPRLAQVPGVDAWFGGHSHNQVIDTVNGIPVAIAGSHGTTIAVCDLVVDPLRHEVAERRARLVNVFADDVRDTVMQANVERWNAAVAPIANVRLGSNLHRLTRSRSGESTLGNFVTDAIRAGSGADIAFQNSGGLRADLAEGPVTRGAIYEVMPFDNLVFTLELSGSDVKLALEQALKTDRVTLASGIRYTFDPDAPPMQRVRSLTLADGSPLDATKLYRIACNDFMATGGDDYAVLSAGRNRVQTDQRVRDLLEQQVLRLAQEGKAVDYQPEGRIAKVGGTATDR